MQLLSMFPESYLTFACTPMSFPRKNVLVKYANLKKFFNDFESILDLEKLFFIKE